MDPRIRKGCSNHPHTLQELTNEHAEVFDKSHRSPPERAQDHAIKIKEGCGHV
ncbi:peroxidase 64 [Dorcoceras hygrometricum]|uniref:Peroxidase 64 n=1 Tax=Dorcoceras hygrometricum TaxID=472368 RepID=A0A2Z7DDJ5_9LAMI|nr:peroxidase 64 [Dorcoceras hygrometricum]